MELPNTFIESLEWRYKENCREDFSEFINSFNNDWIRAWRLQTTRMEAVEAAEIMAQELGEGRYTAQDFLRPVPWCQDGYYIPQDARPGLTSLHQMGLIYIQEASAMLPAEVLRPRPGDRVLDLCAAPGGKSLQLAKRLGGSGLLVSNDISESRARALHRNLELAGAQNSYVSVLDPSTDIPHTWFEYFDKVQLDAPCSGEGMFRRDPRAITSWTDFGPESIRTIQSRLLDVAAQVTKVGGHLAYSTCTFNTVENEEMISTFLEQYPQFRVVSVENLSEVENGLQGVGIHADLAKALRIWPQSGLGDGHFCCLLEKTAPIENHLRSIKSKKSSRNTDFPSKKDAMKAYKDFIARHVIDEKQDEYLKKNIRLLRNLLFLIEEELPSMDDLRLLKSGCFLGELKSKGKSHYVLHASHPLLLEMHPEIWQWTLNLSREDERVAKLLRGETISLNDEEQRALAGAKASDFLAILCDGHSLCWGKKNQSTIKNLFPASWVR